MKDGHQWNYYYAVENTGFTANDDRSEGTYQKYMEVLMIIRWFSLVDGIYEIWHL